MAWGPNTKQTALVFDVNETLLDLKVLLPAFEESFGDSSALKRWFASLLQYSMVATISGNYHNFDEIAYSVLEMTAQSFGREISEERKMQLANLLRTLPPHPEVPEALEKLKKAGFVLFALTNSSDSVVEDQMRFSGLGHFFEDKMSVEKLGVFKPHPRVYKSAAYRISQQFAYEDIRMIAAHAWDIAGACSCGWKGALLRRGGLVPYRLAPMADMEAPDMYRMATLLIEQDA